MKFIEWFTGVVNQQVYSSKPGDFTSAPAGVQLPRRQTQDPKRRCGVGEGKEETAII